MTHNLTMPSNIFWPMIEETFVFPGETLVYNGKFMRNGKLVNSCNTPCTVIRVDFEQQNGKIEPLLTCKSEIGTIFSSGDLNEFSRNLPDSWEKIKEDALKFSCDYFDPDDGCESCRAFFASENDSCDIAKAQNIVQRIQKLADQ